MTKDYFLNTYISKPQNVLNGYKEIYNKLIELNKNIKNCSPDKVLYIINEILSEMPDYLHYIDESLYTNIKLLKQFICKNTKDKLIFGKKLKRISAIDDKINQIINFTKRKIDEISFYVTKYGENI